MRIDDPKIVNLILNALADQRSRVILIATAYEPKSVMDLVKNYDLPVSSTYRRVSQLEEAGLLGVAKTIISDDGKKHFEYKSAFVQISIEFQHGNIVINATPNRDIIEKAYRLFHSI